MGLGAQGLFSPNGILYIRLRIIFDGLACMDRLRSGPDIEIDMCIHDERIELINNQLPRIRVQIH